MISVLIADDQALLRGSFRMLIDSASDLTVVGEAGTGAEAVTLARSAAPDVILMDVRMPELDGIEATRAICGPGGVPTAKVLILTTFDLDEYVYGALRAGASGFLLKETSPPDLLTAIRTVASGQGLFAPSVTARLVARYTRPRPPVEVLPTLTDRERDVLELVAAGLANPEIAERLELGISTVKTYINRLLAKLDARDRAQLVIAAYEAGLVVPG